MGFSGGDSEGTHGCLTESVVTNISTIIYYSAASSPQDFSKCFTLLVTHHLVFSGKHPAMLQLLCEDYSYTDIHHCL